MTFHFWPIPFVVSPKILIFLGGKKDLRFLAKNQYFSWTFFAVTWSKMVRNLKDALF